MMFCARAAAAAAAVALPLSGAVREAELSAEFEPDEGCIPTAIARLECAAMTRGDDVAASAEAY